MKSWLGAIAAITLALTFAATYAYAIRTGAGWLDSSPLFLVALPYNAALVAIFGESSFSQDAPLQVLAAAAAEAAPLYVAGALLEALLRWAYRRITGRT